MRYRLRTLLILLAIGPPLLAGKFVENETMRRLGSILAIGGSVALGYGALVFWVAPSLPPNGDGPSGRLPSLYVMGAGIVIVLLGLALQNLRLYGGATAASSGASGSTYVPTWFGVLLLLGLVVAFFVAVSYL